jgi:hypothetical protein
MIAGAGFAMMAWKMAQARYGVRVGFLPYDRDLTWRTHDPLSMEYHRIVNSTTVAWSAFAGERSIGICPRIRP